MNAIVTARTVALAALLSIGVIGCGAATDLAPASATTPAPAATAAPAIGDLAAAAVSSPVPGGLSSDERIEAMSGVMLAEFPDAEDTPEPAMDPPFGSGDLAESGDLEGRAISAVPTPAAIDEQGNLPQPEPGDALIDFTLPRAGGGEVTLSEIGGDQNTVLVFYRAFW